MMEIEPQMEGQMGMLETTRDDRGRAHVHIPGMDPRVDSRAPSRAEAPWTSRAATKSLKTGTWRWNVLEVLFDVWEVNENDGMTHDELEQYFQTTRSTPRARCAELVDMGYVYDTGKTRKNRYGAQALVWAITDAGIDVYNRLREEG